VDAVSIPIIEDVVVGFFSGGSAISGTASNAATIPIICVRVTRSLSTSHASSTGTMGYSDDSTAATSSRPAWVARA
jgi:hypothetical protein